MNAIDYYNKHLSSFSVSAFVGMTPQEPKIITDEQVCFVVTCIRFYNEKQEQKYLSSFKHLIDKSEEDIQKSLLLKTTIMLTVFDGDSNTNSFETVGIQDFRDQLLDSLYAIHHCSTLRKKINQELGEIMSKDQEASTKVASLQELTQKSLEGEQLTKTFDSILLLSKIIDCRKEFIKLAEIKQKLDLLYELAFVYAQNYFKNFTHLNGVRIFNALKPYLDTTLTGNNPDTVLSCSNTTGVVVDSSKYSVIAEDNAALLTTHTSGSLNSGIITKEPVRVENNLKGDQPTST